MRVEQLGEGTPELAIVGAIHGDEPCGARAIERLLADEPAVERPVRLVVANQPALDRGVRYLDADLNRAFGDDGADARERGLARDLAAAVEDCTVLSIHSTQSHPEPFGVVNDTSEPARSICPALSISALVEVDDDEGRPFALEATNFVEVEAGLQGSDAAAENAYRLAREFLTATDALPGPTVANELPVFRLGEPIEKPPAESYEVFVENFARVERGEAFAAADGEPITADEAFYPILVSAEGYETQFGYAGDRLGVLEPPTDDRRIA